MTRTTKPKSERKPKQNQGSELDGDKSVSEIWGGFINVSLSDDEKTYFRQWVTEAADEILEMWKSILDDGLGFSVKADAENSCYIATFTGFAMSKLPNYKASLSARGSDPDQALALLVFKHVVLCEYDWHKFWTAKRTFGAEL